MNPFFSYLCKTAFDKAKRDHALRAIDTARPYAQKGVGGAMAGLWLGSSVAKLRRVAQAVEHQGVPAGRKTSVALAALGAAFGLSDEKLRRLAREAKYRHVLKETRQTQ